MRNLHTKKIIFALAMIFPLSGFTYANSADYVNQSTVKAQNIAIEKQREERKVFNNNFAITLHNPTYILPYYYTGSPYNSIYENQTPSDESLKHNEVKYQFSFKIPVWHDMFLSSTSLFFAYTQLSYWQVYNKNAFFRSTDYEPEFFTRTPINWNVAGNWFLNIFKLGAVHQSNGFGNYMERSWNRVYIEMTASNDHAFLSIKPWYVFHDSTYELYNPDMAKYLGYGQVVLGYKYNNQTISLQAHSFIERHGRYATGTLRYTFPINKRLAGIVEVFSGYGQSLIEYNHRTNSAGVGFALNNFI